jgi:hypothetical protein
VNSPTALDIPGAISADGRTLYMASDRGTAKGDAYVARRPK